NLKNLAINLNLKINFVGHQNDIGSLYEKAKILALPSMSEGFGNVLIEALFYECGEIKIGYFDQTRRGIDDDKSLIELFCPNGG
ncbi:glycosyltransferase family 4 protein, partial [Campylobacter fetus]|uniref:glycosyltransferase family 4 protein n=1 Tax=Campylobacter fetus TaxID=196 RepID=UPI001967C2BF